MEAHTAYCGELLRAGKAVVFGPVADAAGVWGLGVLQLDDGADPQDIVANDPVVKANGRFRLSGHPDAASRDAGDLLMDMAHRPCPNADQIGLLERAGRPALG